LNLDAIRALGRETPNSDEMDCFIVNGALAAVPGKVVSVPLKFR